MPLCIISGCIIRYATFYGTLHTYLLHVRYIQLNLGVHDTHNSYRQTGALCRRPLASSHMIPSHAHAVPCRQSIVLCPSPPPSPASFLRVTVAQIPSEKKGSMCRGLASAYGDTRGRGSTEEWVPATSARALRHLGTRAKARDGKRYIRSTTAVRRTGMELASDTWIQV